MDKNEVVSETMLCGDERDRVLRLLISPLIVFQDPMTLLDTVERIRSTEHTWVHTCMLPDFEKWKESLPNEQITWMGDDCEKLALTLAEKAFPSLASGIYTAIRSLGTDNPTILADGIFEYAKNKLSLFEASLFTFCVIQFLRGDQFAFKQ